MHPLHTFGYKSLLVLVESLQNYREDLHACIFKCADRERERAAIILSKAGQKNLKEKN